MCNIYSFKINIYSKNYILLLVNKKILEKLLRSDSQIIAKLDILINRQRSLENRLTDLEKKLNDNNKNKNIANTDYIKVIT